MATNKKTEILYNGEIKIDFYPDSHRYKKAGEKSFLISVTSVTGMLDKPMLIPWAVKLDIGHIRQYLEERAGQKFTLEELNPIIEEAYNKHTEKKEEAASFGSMVHEYAEKFANAVLQGTEQPEINPEWPDEVNHGVGAFLEWYNTNDVKFVASEKLVYSRELDVVGQADLVAKINGELLLLDYKTSKGVWPEMHYQAAGYRRMWNEEFQDNQVAGVKILHFDKETGNVNVVDIDNIEEATSAFEALVKAKHKLKNYNKLIGAY
jgi:hypothetical protein